jgi:hypothetical protein
MNEAQNTCYFNTFFFTEMTSSLMYISDTLQGCVQCCKTYHQIGPPFYIEELTHCQPTTSHIKRHAH